MLKPEYEYLKAQCPRVSESKIRLFLKALDDTYFKTFSREEQIQHLSAIADLSQATPVMILWEMKGHKRISITVISYNFKQAFFYIVGTLSAYKLRIESGNVFTYKQNEEIKTTPKTMMKSRLKTPLPERFIIDHFEGTLEEGVSPTKFIQKTKEALTDLLHAVSSKEPVRIQDSKEWVYTQISHQISALSKDKPLPMAPISINIDTETSPFTRILIQSQDTPFFLFSLIAALTQFEVTIEHVRIRTVHGAIFDEIDVLTQQGKKITDPNTLNQLKFCMILTKQFSHYLHHAPNPYDALTRFADLLKAVFSHPDKTEWESVLTNPKYLLEFSRVLGASDYLWEEMVQTQYENLYEILQTSSHLEPLETIQKELEDTLKQAGSFEKKCSAINEFKDRHRFQTDIYQMMGKLNIWQFSKRLTKIAEYVIQSMANACLNHIRHQHGTIHSNWALLGLGKLGGESLGYASDIELLMIIAPKNDQDLAKIDADLIFFTKMLELMCQSLHSKKDGIFEIDLRLRPYGESGAKVITFEKFKSYYGKGGKALDYEKLALVRLRPIAGDAALGLEISQSRDALIYHPDAIDSKGLWDLRKKQFETKAASRWNAKFSAGGLVDIEYAVQVLQVTYGHDYPKCRTPKIKAALLQLNKAGVLDTITRKQITDAYTFFRRLINGLRMLRGSAKELNLPSKESHEFFHLARRIGYEDQGYLKASQQLTLEFKTQTAIVRQFIVNQFDEESLASHRSGNIVDLLIAKSISDAEKEEILIKSGFKNTQRAMMNLERIYRYGNRRKSTLKLILLACEYLERIPDPDRALNDWERFMAVLPDPLLHYDQLNADPKFLGLLMELFSSSEDLSNTLIRMPSVWDWLMKKATLTRLKTKKQYLKELQELRAPSRKKSEWIQDLRRYKQREYLRIFLRDVALETAFLDIVTELSDLAEAMLRISLESALIEHLKHPKNKPINPKSLCILAMGKLGGRELNYSSDIDLIVMTKIENKSQENDIKEILREIQQQLTSYTADGFLYRVDYNLRPFGKGSDWVIPIDSLIRYYEKVARPWEIQALLKARPIAGNLDMGRDFLEEVMPKMIKRFTPMEYSLEIKRNRAQAQKTHKKREINIKEDWGGIRDIEFTVQYYQLLYSELPDIITGNTLNALSLLARHNALPLSTVSILRDHYLLFRRIEHFLQILHNRQVHELPKDTEKQQVLARQILGKNATKETLWVKIENSMADIQRIQETFVYQRAQMATE